MRDSLVLSVLDALIVTLVIDPLVVEIALMFADCMATGDFFFLRDTILTRFLCIQRFGSGGAFYCTLLIETHAAVCHVGVVMVKNTYMYVMLW